MRKYLISLLCLVMVMMARPAGAIDRTWTGGGTTANWSDAANWGGIAPVAGDKLIFPVGAARKSNNNDILTSVGGISFNESGYTLAGNDLALNGNIGNIGDNLCSINFTIADVRTIESYAGTTSGTLTLTGSFSLGSTGSVLLNANHTTGNDGNLTVSGVISGTGTGIVVTKGGSGVGVVTLGGENTYEGNTAINSGFLQVSNDANLGLVSDLIPDRIQFGGGYLRATSSFTLEPSRGATITAANATTGFWADSGITLTYGGSISESGSLNYNLSLDGEGTIVLTGSSTYTGFTKVIVDIARISDPNAFGAGTADGGARVEINALSTVELTNDISVDKDLFIDYGKLVNLSGNNAWAGLITIGKNTTGKSIIRSKRDALYLSTINVLTDYITNPVNAFQNLYAEGSGNITIQGSISGNGKNSVNGSGYILGHGDVVMDGTGTLTLSGLNTYSGRTIVNSGIVAVGTDRNLGAVPASTTNRIIINGGTLEATGSFDLSSKRGIALGSTTGSGSGTIKVDSNYSVVYGGIIANNGSANAFNLTGTGKLVLTNASTYSGVTTITDATLQIGNNGTTGSLNPASQIIDNGTLAFNQTDTVTEGTEFNAIISGTGGVSQNGTGKVILNNANTYQGPTAVNAGRLLVNNTTGSGTGTGAVTVNNTAKLGGTGTIAGSVTAKSGGRIEPGTDASTIGTLNIGGAVSLEAGSIYEVEIGSGTTCDKLNLLSTGTMTMNSAAKLDIVGTVTGDGRTLAYGIARNSITGEFIDTSSNPLEDKTVLHLAPNTAYTIRYMDMTTSDDGHIVLKLDPTAAGSTTRAYATPNGVVVEFQTIDEAGQNDIILYLSRNGHGQLTEVGRQPATGAGSHTYRFLVPDLSAGDVVNLIIRDDEGKTHAASGLLVESFTALSAQIAQTDATGITLQWASTPGRIYDVYRTAKLDGVWEYVQTIEASTAQTSASVAFDPAQTVGFFRIGVR